MRRILMWLLTVPILCVGLVAGHELGYRLGIPDPHERAHALEQTGHGYLAYWPYLAALAAALTLAGLAMRFRLAVSGRRAHAPPYGFAALPPFAFLLLELLECVATGQPVGSLFTSPAVLYGLALQLPLAVLALLVARLLGRVADAVGGVFAASSSPRPSTVSLSVPAGEPDLVRPPVAALAYGVRGPPAFA